jgi:hypothetical protein
MNTSGGVIASGPADDTLEQMKTKFLTMFAVTFLNISFALYERLQNPVQKSIWEMGGKRPTASAEENADLRACKKYVWLFPAALDMLATIPIDGMDPSIITALSTAFKTDIGTVPPSNLVSERIGKIPINYQKESKFVYLANEAISLFKTGCNVSPSKTMRLVNLAKNTTSEGDGAYSIVGFGEAATYYLRIMNPTPSTGGTPSAGKQVATDLQKRLDAMRGIKPLPLGPSGKPMTGKELSQYLQAKLDAMRYPTKGGARRKTMRRRKSHRRHRRSVRR